MKLGNRLGITNFIKLLLLLGALSLAIGCTDDEPQETTVDLGRWQQLCDIDTENLKLIFEVTITREINCLTTNLTDFAKLVKTERPGIINRNELIKFIQKFYPDLGGHQLKTIDFLFKLNSLMLKEQNGYISVGKVKMLGNVLNLINKYGVKFKQIFTDLDSDVYRERREEIIDLAKEASTALVSPLVSIGGTHENYTIWGILQEIQEAFNIDNFKPENLKPYFFVKKLILGGKKDDINNSEFIELVKKAPAFLTLYLDLNYFGLHNFFEDKQVQENYLGHVAELTSLLYNHSANTVIVSHDEMVQTIYQVSKKKISLESLHEFLSHFKSQVIGGDSQEYTFKEIKTLLSKAQFFLELLYFNSVTYEHYKEIIEQDAPLPDLHFPNLEDYRHIRGSSLIDHWKQFEEFAAKTRFFFDEYGKIHFNFEIKRSLKGLQTITLLYEGLSWVFSKYGEARDDGVFEMTKGHFRKVVGDYKIFLQEVGVLPLHVEKTIKEVFLAGDLFHVHSDGNLKLSDVELAETAIILMNSGEGLDALIHDMLQVCPDQGGREPAFTTECFRENFHHMFLVNQNMMEYYPNFYQEWLGWDEENRLDQLINLEKNARLSGSMEEPITRTEVGRLITAMSNIESLFTLYDVDKDNQLTHPELLEVFEVVKEVLAEKANLPFGGDGLLKSIFFYLIKHKKEPSTFQLLWFHVTGRKKKIVAGRDNAAAIFAQLAGGGN